MKHDEILRAAQSVQDKHGANAPTHIAQRADAMREAGDLDGCRLWLRILEALKDPGISKQTV